MRKAILLIVLLFITTNLVFSQNNVENAKKELAKYMKEAEKGNYDKSFEILYAALGKYDYGAMLNEVWLTKLHGFLITDTYFAIDKDIEKSESISKKWLNRAKLLSPPNLSQTSNFDDYCIVMYQLASYYLLNEKDTEEAFNYYLIAESYYNGAEFSIDGMKTWINSVRKTLKKLIEDKTIKIGSYVTNPSTVQKWIGRVISINNDIYNVRITFNTSYSDFVKSKTYPMVKDEISLLESVSLNAVIQGYK